MENDKSLEYEEFSKKIETKSAKEIKEEIISLIKAKMGNRNKISSTEFDNMMEIHLIQNYITDDTPYKLTYLNNKVFVEHYLYQEFEIIKR